MRLFYEREIARSKYCKRRQEVRKQKAAAAATQKNKTVVIIPADDASAASAGSAAAAANGSTGASAAQSAKDDKITDSQLKEKADKLKQLEEEKAEKDYQRLFDQFKSTLANEDMRTNETNKK